MADREATVELAVTARDLAANAFGDVAEDMQKVARTATEAAGKVGTAFAGTGRSISVGIGAAVDSLVTGGSLGDAFVTLGGFMAGELTENFGEQAIEKLTSSTLVGAIIAPMAGIGSSIGGALAAAIPVGMALAPVLIIAAIAGAIALLIANPDIRGKVIAFAGGVVDMIVSTLRNLLGALPKIVGALFAAAWEFVLTAVKTYIALMATLWLELPSRLIGLGADIVRTIIGGLASLPGRVADIIASAFRNLHIDIGPFHISSSGVTIDLPNIDLPHFAVGTPFVPADMLAVVHKGEAIIPARANPFAGGSAAGQQVAGVRGVMLEGVSEDDVADIIDRRLFVRLRRASLSSST